MPYPHNALDFSQHPVLVAGGSSGIGRGIATAFADAGAQVSVWGTRDSAAAYDPPDALSRFDYQQVDLQQRQQIERAAERHEALHTLVLSQGTVRYGRGEYTADGFRDVVDLNLTSVMDCCLAFEKALGGLPGNVIVIGSVASFRATRGNPAYAASKSGLLGLLRSLADAWAGRGIRVNGIAPGFVETQLTRVTFDDEKRREATRRAIPMNRFGTPQDMAGAALFLASPLAAYMTGQMLVVDGGMTLA